MSAVFETSWFFGFFPTFWAAFHQLPSSQNIMELLKKTQTEFTKCCGKKTKEGGDSISSSSPSLHPAEDRQSCQMAFPLLHMKPENNEAHHP